MISRCAIIVTLPSGLEHFTLTDHEYAVLDGKIMSLGRRALAGLATHQHKVAQ